MKTNHRAPVRRLLLTASLLSLASAAHADLTDPRILAQLTPLERAAALANQAVYNALTGAAPPGSTPPGGPVSGGELEGGLPSICSEENDEPFGACTGAVFQVFDNVRELVHTANNLGGNGPTRFGLGLDVAGLGAALRWTAAEEIAAHRSAAVEFSSYQLGALLGRLSALRFGATSPSTLQFSQQFGSTLEFSGELPLRLGAYEDDGSITRRLSAFINGSFGYGKKRDTTNRGGFEDAFDFDGTQATLGVDYRLSPGFVIGGLLGLTDRKIDFDSRASVVDGRIDSNGGGLTLYAQWESESAYAAASIGRQRLKHKMARRITYPSLNPLVPSVDTTAFSETTSSALTATLNLGYDMRRGGLTVGPYFKSDMQRVLVDPFSEVDSDGFAFRYNWQRITSIDVAAGTRVQYVLTPTFGVVVPYMRGEYHKEMNPQARTISATYIGLGALTADTALASFSLPTDRRDGDYFQVAGGFSLVMRHGLQGFVQYQQALGMRPFTDRAITGGLRLEF